MKGSNPRFLTVISLAAVVVFLAAPAAVGAAEMSGAQIDMEAARAVFEETCGQCHALSRPLSRNKDRAGWENTVSRMSSYHERRFDLPIPEDEQKAIVEYLLQNAGK